MKFGLPLKVHVLGLGIIFVYFATLWAIGSSIPANDICPIMPVEGDHCDSTNPNNQLARNIMIWAINGGVLATVYVIGAFVHILWVNRRRNGAGLG